ncbi:hypothetical protein [Streptomyces sp. NBC_01217]|uniref:hypothetical protein n=1 Tax=Streptomyces sp. NBC_01217 TaxID=2903779 RepID=UPI002E14E6EA|nr:hypothetical protein OG507_13940 [Streptomyces sp. NBC_01217]
MGLLVIRGTGRAGEAGEADEAGEGGEAGRGGRGGRGRPHRVLVSLFVLPLVAAVGLVLGGTGAGSADAATVCAGRPAKTVGFETGELRVYKSRSYACAVAVAKKPGPRRRMSVSIQARGGNPVVDSGKYTRRAGPVTVHALNRCVRASATISGKSGSTGWILC